MRASRLRWRLAGALAAMGLSGCAVFLPSGGQVYLPENPETPAPSAKEDSSPWTPMAPGCGFWRFAGAVDDIPQEVFVFRVALTRSELRLEVTADAAKRTLFEFREVLAERLPIGRVIATVNGTPLGCIAEGRVVSTPPDPPAGVRDAPWWFVFDRRGAQVRPMARDALRVGDPAPDGIVGGLCSFPAHTPPVVREGIPYASGYPKESGVAGQRNPRTIVGVNRQGDAVFFVIVSGRSPDAAGMTLAEAGRFLTEQLPEIHSAVNLDGGGSSALVIADETFGPAVPRARLRSLPNALHVVAAPPATASGP